MSRFRAMAVLLCVVVPVAAAGWLGFREHQLTTELRAARQLADTNEQVHAGRLERTNALIEELGAQLLADREEAAAARARLQEKLDDASLEMLALEADLHTRDERIAALGRDIARQREAFENARDRRRIRTMIDRYRDQIELLKQQLDEAQKVFDSRRDEWEILEARFTRLLKQREAELEKARAEAARLKAQRDKLPR